MESSELTRCAKWFSNTTAFRRLWGVRQLGVAILRFPTATHSRAEHSLGVARLAGRVIKVLSKKHPQLGLVERDLEIAEVAGLFHDVGHGPFSHTFDYVLEGVVKVTPSLREVAEHEDRALFLLDSIGKQVDCPLRQEDLETVKWMIRPSFSKCAPAHVRRRGMEWMSDIVCNCVHGIDVDKMDYLLRDALHLVESLPTVPDVLGVIDRSAVVEGRWTFHIDDEKEIAAISYARHHMHQKFYCHPDVICHQEDARRKLLGAADVIRDALRDMVEGRPEGWYALDDEWASNLISPVSHVYLHLRGPSLRDAGIPPYAVMNRVAYVSDIDQDVITDEKVGEVEKVKWGIYKSSQFPSVCLPKVIYHDGKGRPTKSVLKYRTKEEERSLLGNMLWHVLSTIKPESK